MIRHLYCWLLGLHPAAFRGCYADEMLSIFDQERRHHRAAAFLADVVVSLVRQWIFRPEFFLVSNDARQPEPVPTGVPHFYLCGSEVPRTSSLINGGFLAVAVFAAVSFLIGHGGSRRLLLIGSHHPSLFHLFPTPTQGLPTGDLDAEITIAPDRSLGERDQLRGFVTNYFHVILVLDVLDANHDNELSSDEIANAAVALRKLDTDRDGWLSAAECGQKFDAEPPAALSADELTALVMKFDRNHDGRIQRDELPERMRSIFDRTPPRSYLTADDIRGIALEQAAKLRAPDPTPAFYERARIGFMRLHPVLATLDADHDGVISAAEIANAPAALKRLDLNYDHRLTASELLPNPVLNEVALIFRLDTDGDGRISTLERATTRGTHYANLLDSADRNRDGFVTEEELEFEVRRRADLDSNGVVTWTEMLKARRDF